GDKFALLETAGPHKDNPELRLGAFRWFNHWLKHDDGSVIEQVREPFAPEQLRVFDKLPADARNAQIQDPFVDPEPIQLPEQPNIWKSNCRPYKILLKSMLSSGWPAEPPRLDAKIVADVRHDGLRQRAIDFVSEDDVPLRLWVATGDRVEKPALVVLTALNE